MKILPLNISNFDRKEVLDFFSKYSFEQFYKINLNLQESVFLDFLVHKVERRIENSSNLWQVRSGNNLIAIYGLDEEKVNSSSYHKRIYQLTSFYNFTNFAKDAFILINNHITTFCIENKVDMVRCKIDAEDHVNVSYLLSEHYHYNASSCKMYFDINSAGMPKHTIKHRYKVRPYEKSDEKIVISILGQHKKNELYYNLDLPIETTSKIFEQYFLRQSQYKETTPLVLEDLISNKLLGLSLHTEPYNFNSKVQKSLITWDLIVIDQVERGKGLGNLLFSHIIHQHKSDIELSTMSENLQMLKFLHKIGFYKVGEFNHLYKKFPPLPEFGK